MQRILTIPPHIEAQYELYAAFTKKPVETVLVNALTNVAGISPETRHVIVAPDDLARIEHAFGDVPVSTGAHLADRVVSLAGLKIGEIALDPFTPGQWAQIAQRAERLDQTPAQYCAQIVKQMSMLFFDHLV